MRIAVTGANGYLGQGIVRQLLDDGVEVFAADFAADHIDKRATIYAGNLFELEKPYEALGEPEILLHLAWRDGFRHASDAHIDDLPNHYHFLNKMISAGIKKVCVLGSMHEVGFFEGSIDENTPTNPQSLYGIGKNALRNATSLMCKEHHVIFQWVRGFYIVGNAEYGCSIFSKIAQSVKEGKKEFPFTTGQNQYDFIDYDEFCMQVASVVEQDEVTGIINCCSGKPEKLGERVERFIKDNHYNITLQYGSFPDRPYDSKAIWGNNQKIQKIIEIVRG